MLAIFVLSIWTLSFFVSRILEADMLRVLGEQQFSTVSLVAYDINKQLTERLDALEKISSKITPSILNNKKSMQNFFDDRLVLQSLFNGGIIAYQLDGIAIADSSPSAGRIGVNYIDIDTVYIALRENKSNIGRPVMGKKLNAPVFGITAPIHGSHGEVIGAVSGITNLGLPNFLDKIANHSYGKTGGYLLIAPEYRMIITATDKRRVMSILPPLGVNPIVDKFINGYEGYDIFTNPIGENVLASAKNIPVARWYVGLQILVEEAFYPIYIMQKRMLWITILLTFFVGIITWWILRRQLAPILSTVEVLATMANNNQALQPLPVLNNLNEVGALVVGFNKLITIAAQRQVALAEGENRYRRLFNEMMSGFATHEIICDAHGTPVDYRFLAVNTAFEKMTGLTSEAAVGKTILEIMPTTELMWIQRYGKVALTGQPNYFESYSGVLNRHFEVRAFSPEIGQFATIFYDITDRKQAAAVLQQQAEALTRSNAELEQFAYIVSHDLRQPLRMVTSYIQMLDRRLADKLDEETRKMMGFAMEGAKRMDQMLVSLLEYSRVGRQGEPLVPIASQDTVDEALRFLAPVIAEAHANIHISSDWPLIMASRNELTRLWQNLIGNAVKYRAPHRTPIIKITVESKAGGHGWHFCVEDNGIGVNPDQFNRLFQVFQRLHTRNEYEGNGIGLAVARKIVEHHGGRIWIESGGPDQGSRFCFDLPELFNEPSH